MLTKGGQEFLTQSWSFDDDLWSGNYVMQNVLVLLVDIEYALLIGGFQSVRKLCCRTMAIYIIGFFAGEDS